MVDVRVEKRVLWVGNAAYPLRNITRVHSKLLRPNRVAALEKFFLRALVIGAVGGVLGVTTGSFEGGGNGLVLIVGGAAVLAAVSMLGVLVAPAVPVLVVDTAGGPTAVVTHSDQDEMARLLGRLTQALDDPDAHFRFTMETLTVSPRYYHFGDSVNMYGGLGNVGKVIK
ncbi:DUF6232 family protein [Kitasatospora sp. NPDC004289]